MPWGCLGAVGVPRCREIAASWRAEVRRQQTDGSFEADLEEGVHVLFQVTLNPYGSTRRQLGFVAVIGYRVIGYRLSVASRLQPLSGCTLRAFF